MSFQCPHCRRRLPMADVNVAADTALCRACGIPLRYSELLDTVTTASTATPPRGTWRTDDGRSLRIGASCRSWGAIPLLGINIFWNGIVGVFVVAAFKSGNYWILLLISLHAGIGLFLAWSLALTLLGRVEVTLAGSNGTTFTGVGPLGIRKKFDPAAVRTVRRERVYASRGGSNCAIAIDADRTLKFGSTLSDDRREWMMAALGETLLQTPPLGRTGPFS